MPESTSTIIRDAIQKIESCFDSLAQTREVEMLRRQLAEAQGKLETEAAKNTALIEAIQGLANRLAASTHVPADDISPEEE